VILRELRLMIVAPGQDAAGSAWRKDGGAFSCSSRNTDSTAGVRNHWRLEGTFTRTHRPASACGSFLGCGGHCLWMRLGAILSLGTLSFFFIVGPRFSTAFPIRPGSGSSDHPSSILDPGTEAVGRSDTLFFLDPRKPPQSGWLNIG
jgi:hypothetical protein